MSEEQSTFVPGRSIIDNALIAIELIHYLKCKKKGALGDVALKLDISKAYERVSWEYLQEIMLKLGFDLKWVKWILMFDSSVHYSVMMNSDEAGCVSPGRGLRQGDPLSPYLYILCTEGLSFWIKIDKGRGQLHGTKLCMRALIITHLFFLRMIAFCLCGLMSRKLCA